MKVSYTISKKNNSFKTACRKTIEFGINCYFKIVPGGLPGSSQSLPRQAPGSPKASSGSLCDSCLAPPGPPCEPLAPPWHCKGASKSHFGSLGTPNVWLLKVLGPKFRLEIEDLSVMLLISTILSLLSWIFLLLGS